MKRLLLAVAVAVLVPSTAALALTVKPDWVALPSPDDLAAAYPASARAKGVAGGAVLDCAVTDVGRLAECRVTREWPANEGFGEAAIQLSHLFALRRAPEEPNHRRISVPIRFSLPHP